MTTSYICQECGYYLTEEEHLYYEYRCEDCESEWHDRLVAYRKGADDPELDALFSTPRKYTMH